MSERLLHRIKLVLGEIDAHQSRTPINLEKLKADEAFQDHLQQVHQSLTVELFKAGDEDVSQEIINQRFQVKTRGKKDSFFVPQEVKNLEPKKSIVGLTNGADSNRPHVVRRRVVGRILVEIGSAGGPIVFDEYVVPESGRDIELFEVARRHEGISGTEGVVRKTVFPKKAQRLQFTGRSDKKKIEENVALNAGDLVKAA